MWRDGAEGFRLLGATTAENVDGIKSTAQKFSVTLRCPTQQDVHVWGTICSLVNGLWHTWLIEMSQLFESSVCFQVWDDCFYLVFKDGTLTICAHCVSALFVLSLHSSVDYADYDYLAAPLCHVLHWRFLYSGAVVRVARSCESSLWMSCDGLPAYGVPCLHSYLSLASASHKSELDKARGWSQCKKINK